MARDSESTHVLTKQRAIDRAVVKITTVAESIDIPPVQRGILAAALRDLIEASSAEPKAPHPTAQSFRELADSHEAQGFNDMIAFTPTALRRFADQIDAIYQNRKEKPVDKELLDFIEWAIEEGLQVRREDREAGREFFYEITECCWRAWKARGQLRTDG